MNNDFRQIGMFLVSVITFLTSSAYDFEVEGIYYDFVSVPDFTCKVSSSPNGKYSGDIIIPEYVTYNNRQVKVISIDGAFKGCSSLTSINLPNSVTTIGAETFYGCSSLTSINIPNSVTTIGAYAFSYCSSLTSINIPNSVTTIEEYTFRNCSSLTSINIPNSVTIIEEYAFRDCSSLTSINIPNSVTTIEEYVFYGCSSLENIHLSCNLTTLYPGSFYNCNALSSLTIPGQTAKLVLYHYFNDIDRELFYKCDKLNELILEHGVEPLSALYSYGSSILASYSYSKCDLIFFSEILQRKNGIITDYKILPIQRATIDRELSNKIRLDALEHYTMGEHITMNQVDLSYSTNLESIICTAEVPPTGMGGLTNLQYANVMVKVPKESLDAYKKADGWKNFWNIESIDETGGITDVASDEGNVIGDYVVYNLQGVMVLKTVQREDLMKLPAGLYIVNGKKMLIK